jgi:lysophospholipase
MSPLHAEWLNREQQFSAFVTGPLLDFWQRHEQGEFLGVGGVPIRFVRFSSPHHPQVVVVSPGRGESYIKYSELAYDLYHSGYDVMIIDHRGQGCSGRLLADPHRGHVVNFTDYVDDFAQFYQQQVLPHGYQQHLALGHSMGGAILAQFLLRQPQAFAAAVLCAPMLRIHLPIPGWMATGILNWAEKRQALRDYYALGSGQWRPQPYVMNVLTHSRARYLRSVHYYADHPELQVGGPTYHWVRESIQAGQQIIDQAANITTPILLLQASEEQVVDNRAQQAFCQVMSEAGHPCAGGKPWVIAGARHEILFERDAQRAEALHAILRFFAHYAGGAVTTDHTI